VTGHIRKQRLADGRGDHAESSSFPEGISRVFRCPARRGAPGPWSRRRPIGARGAPRVHQHAPSGIGLPWDPRACRGHTRCLGCEL